MHPLLAAPQATRPVEGKSCTSNFVYGPLCSGELTFVEHFFVLVAVVAAAAAVVAAAAPVATREDLATAFLDIPKYWCATTGLCLYKISVSVTTS